MAPDGDLGDLLAKVLPTGAALTVRHISSTPSPCTALFAAAPGQKTDATFCENHFLSVSIDSPKDDGAEIIVFGMEVLVYNSAHLTTIFVSKADSTGLLHLLKLPQKVSILRLVSHTFLSYLARTHQRPGVRLIISLFARAQNQYLFPGSIENAEKHVLDDRGLIKWWCRAVDPILRENEPESVSHETNPLDQTVEAAKASATAHLIVPGCDRFETRSFFPPTAKSDAKDRPRWLATYPLKQMVQNPSAPPRCLVPRFPDDPKTRFLIDLDDELPENTEGAESTIHNGQWRSVKSLDQFWEMMSFRQECSAGRLVGFLWLVINPPGLMNSTTMASQTRGSTGAKSEPKDQQPSKAPVDEPLPKDIKETTTEQSPDDTTNRSDPPAASFDCPTAEFSTEVHTLASSTDINPFFWPEAGRGDVVLSEADYKTMMDGVLDHFYDEKEVVASTKNFVDQVASLADQLTWGKRVVGSHSPAETSTDTTETKTLLDSSLIRKRKKSDAAEKTIGDSSPAVTTDAPAASSAQPGDQDATQAAPVPAASINVLSAGLVRKKKKT